MRPTAWPAGCRGHATAATPGRPATAAASRGLSSYHIGRAFEERAIALLTEAGLDLRPTGGAFDGGIDFRGFLGQRGDAGSVRVPVIGQCKAEARKIGARYLRDFEGVLAREPQSIGIFVALSGYSTHAQKHFGSSTFPLVLVRITHRIDSLQVNRAAQALLPGLTVGVRIVPPTRWDPAAAPVREPLLLVGTPGAAGGGGAGR